MGPHQRAPTLLQRRQAQTRKGCESRPFEKKIQISDLAMGRIFMRDLIIQRLWMFDCQILLLTGMQHANFVDFVVPHFDERTVVLQCLEAN